jgi:cytochrome c heme-lyase
MKRKGWDGIEEESIPSFLQVHNSVNERSWKQLCEWEHQQTKPTATSPTGSNGIELVRFEGRPNDLSPKAWLLSTFFFHDRPFDRHDWYISNNGGVEKRYVLDFYMTESPHSGLPKVDIDVRPALDTPEAFVQRGVRLLRDMFPGITKELERFHRSQQQ